MSRPDWLIEAERKLAALPPQEKVEVTRGVYLRKKVNGIPVLSVYYYADPERDPQTAAGAVWFDRTRKKYSSQGAWDREQEIDDNAGGGELLLAPYLARHKDVIIISDPTWMPNPLWEAVEGFDHGKTNATALIKGYLDFDGNLYLCGEFYSYQREGWDNHIWQNAPYLNALHDIRKPRWCMADPSIFDQQNQAQKDGSYTNLDTVYRKNGVTFLGRYDGERSDLTFIERLYERWARVGETLEGTGQIIQPKLYIVCRNASERLQPGLHPFDCPNLLWELKRAKRAQLTATQLMTRNPTEKVVDKYNHARDAFKYMLMMLPRPTEKPAEMRFAEQIQQTEAATGRPMNDLSKAVAMGRFIGMERQRVNSRQQVSMMGKRRPGRL